MQVTEQDDNDALTLADGGTVFVCAYIGVDGLAGDLAEGETFTTHDGCTVTRRGVEALWTTPPGRR